MRSVVRIAILPALLSLGLALSGCATPVQTVNLRPPSERAPTSDEGVLTLSVTVNTNVVGQFDTLVLKREGDPDPKTAGAQYEYVVPEVTGRVARDTSLFVASLKAGDYTIVRMRDSSALTTFTPAPSDALLGSFKIAPGKLTDLGRVVIMPLDLIGAARRGNLYNDAVVAGRSRLIRSNDALVARFAPSTERFYQGALASGWNTPRNDKDIVEELSLAHPVGLGTLVELADGRVAAPTRLGTILLREPSGRWRALRSGTLDAWMGVAPAAAPDAVLVAVGEYSNIAKVDAKGVFHPVERGNLPMGTLFFVAGDMQHGWVVALKLNSKVTLYRTDSLDRPDWTPLLTDTLNVSFWTGAQQLWLWPTKSGFGYARSTGEIRFYDMAAKAWSERTSPDKKAIITLAPSPGDTLGILTSPGGGFGGVTAAAWLSRDNAQSWEETGSPFTVKVNPPKLSASGVLLQSGGVFGKQALHGSRDLGKTWTMLSDKVSVSDTVLPMPTTGLFKIGHGGVFGAGRDLEWIGHSSDDGATWVTEYSSFERALPEKPKGPEPQPKPPGDQKTADAPATRTAAAN